MRNKLSTQDTLQNQEDEEVGVKDQEENSPALLNTLTQSSALEPEVSKLSSLPEKQE